MNSFSFFWLILQLSSALSSPPAPVNVSISSVNFQHVLRWDPGTGSPPGTQYRVWKGVYGRKIKLLPELTSQTSLKLKLNMEKQYYLAVQAFYNQTQSPKSREILFYPYTSTIIGPPTLSLVGYTTLIQGNISLPESYMQELYHPTFSVLWRKGRTGEIQKVEKYEKNFTLENLEADAEYCVQVQIKIVANRNTRPSDWFCTSTSAVEPQTGWFALGITAALVILLTFILMTGAFCLCYTGFICKMKKAMPKAFMIVPRQDSILTPDRIISDQVFISSETRNQRKPNHPTLSPPSTGDTTSEEEEDEDDEEENGMILYVNRDAELSSGEDLHQDSGSGCRNLNLAVPNDSGSLEVTCPADAERLEAERDPYESKTERVSLIYDRRQTGVQEPITDEQVVMEQKEVQEVSGNINLFSVTLASLAPCDEEEQNSRNSFTNFLKDCSLNPLNQTDSQTEPEDQMFVPLNFARNNFSDSVCDSSRCPDTLIQQEEEDEEEEEEEEFSEYMSHR